MDLIYLASPHSNSDSCIRELRYQYAVKALAYFMLIGENVFSPICHSHESIIRYNLPADFEFFKEFDLGFIEKCKKLYVLCIEGWRESRGVGEEIEYARKLGIKVSYWKFVEGGFRLREVKEEEG